MNGKFLSTLAAVTTILVTILAGNWWLIQRAIADHEMRPHAGVATIAELKAVADSITAVNATLANLQQEQNNRDVRRIAEHLDDLEAKERFGSLNQFEQWKKEKLNRDLELLLKEDTQ